MNETQTLLAETCNRLFSDLVTPDLLRAAESGEWPADLWAACEENGLTRPLVPEAQGGAGLGWQDVYPILHAAGYHAAPVPLAETIVAGWLLAEAGAAVPDGVISLSCGDDGLKTAGAGDVWRATGQLDRVPWGTVADYVLAVGEHGEQHQFVLIDKASISPRLDLNIGRDSRAVVRVFDATPVAVADVPAKVGFHKAHAFGALTRSVQMAGAIAAVLDLCVQYASERVQFGRPLAKFQAIQHQLAVLAGEVAAAQLAAQYACLAADASRSSGGALLELATAKIRTGEAAGKVAAISHQVHGAIGFTDEYRLHYLTRRLWSWRSEFGAESHWSAELGSNVISRGPGRLWENISRPPYKRAED